MWAGEKNTSEKKFGNEKFSIKSWNLISFLAKKRERYEVEKKKWERKKIREM